MSPGHRRHGQRGILLALLVMLATAIAACSQESVPEVVPEPVPEVTAPPQAFEVESVDTLTAGAWALQPDRRASSQMAVVAAAPGTGSEANADPTPSSAPVAQAAAGSTTEGDAAIPFDVEAPGGYVAHLRLWVPSGTATAVALGIDGASHEVPVTTFGRYAWIAAPVAELQPGAHRLTLGLPPTGTRYDLAVVSRGPLPTEALDAFGQFDTTEPDTPVPPAADTYPVREVRLYGPVLEWSARAADVEGNPFDVAASATFTHQDGEERTTELFFDGDDVYRFRFHATRPGRWTFRTRSDVAGLDGLTGTVQVLPTDDPAAHGSYRAAGNKIAVPVGNDGHLQGVAYQIYMDAEGPLQQIGKLPTDPDRLRDAVDAGLDRAEEQGFNAIFVGVYNNWFALGARSWDLHDSTNPDRATFRVLETILARAQARGLGVHLWMWGDEELRMTPEGVGGIGGAADLRLQRYIAARLGPLPGWTMGYGFDLNEWVTPDQVRAWEETINGRSGWPHLLTGREAGDFAFGEEPLALVSNDLRPLLDGIGTYAAATDAFGEADGRPVIFERRFMYRRNDLWTMDATRRALWHLTMAGGAASIWGTHFDDDTPYPKPGQLRAFREFWRARLDVDLAPAQAADGTRLLASPDGRRVIGYAEDTQRLTLPVVPGGRAVALDTRAEAYTEIALQPPEGATAWTWEAPHRSDWAIAFTAP